MHIYSMYVNIYTYVYAFIIDPGPGSLYRMEDKR